MPILLRAARVARVLAERRCAAVVVSGFFCLWVAAAQADFPALALKPVSLTQIVSPVAIANAGDGSSRLFVCDQGGKIRIIYDGMLLPAPFLDISSKLVALSAGYDERGLLSIAFHPNYSKLDASKKPLPGFGKFYLFYSAPSPNAPGTTSAPVNCRTTISEFQVSATNPNLADPNSERIVLAFDKPQLNHNGGQLQFGPDGLLYISVGDGGSQHDNDYGHTGGAAGSPITSGNLGNAQDKTNLFGKILRIDPLGVTGPTGQYAIPAANPFVGQSGGVRSEIYAFGLRNPWRFSFDDGTGGTNRLIEGDVGQDNVEEVNNITAGGNYGWRVMEGTYVHDNTRPNSDPAMIPPIAEYAHTSSGSTYNALPKLGVSVTGGYVYRGAAFPSLAGRYVFGEYSRNGIGGTAAGTMLGLEENPVNSNNWTLSVPLVAGGNPLNTRIYAFGRDEQGEVYVATKVTKGPFELDSNGLPTGGIYKVVPPQVSTAVLNPVKDNSIFSDATTNSDAGGMLTSGLTASGGVRRALLSFNVAAGLPAGAIVASAKLTLNLTSAGAAASANVALYRLTQDWGEGTSDPQGTAGGGGAPATKGDATWLASFYDPSSPTSWTTAGGTYNAASVSASLPVPQASGPYTWSSSQLAADVQSMLGTPASNFGWILVGDESANSTARRFNSRESAAALQPALTVTYNPTLPPLSRRESWLRQYYPTPGTFVDDLADPDGDGVINLMEYAFAFSPLAANSPRSGIAGSSAPLGANTVFTITFRRDPRATDLSYYLQTSSDLVAWKTIVTSAAGAVPTGSGFASEADAPGESPVKVVTATETLLSPARRFTRLLVQRVPQ